MILRYGNKIVKYGNNILSLSTSSVLNDFIAAYFFETNGNDENGNYDLSVVGPSASYVSPSFIPGYYIVFSNVGHALAYNTFVFSNAITISFWAYWTSQTGHGHYISIRNRTGINNTLALGNGWTAGKTSFFLATENDGLSEIVSDNILNDGNWHHIVALYDGVKQKMYIDNVKQTTEISKSGNLLPASEWTLGQSGINTDYLTARIDQMRIYNRALTSLEISLLWNKGSGI